MPDKPLMCNLQHNNDNSNNNDDDNDNKCSLINEVDYTNIKLK